MTDTQARALEAIGLTRARGLNFYGHFIGLSGDPPKDGHATLRLGTRATSSAALATLVDMATGSAVRSLIEPGILLSTVTLALHQYVGDYGSLEARAHALPVQHGHGLVQCVVFDSDAAAPIGHAQAWFAVVPTSGGATPGLMPWEYADPPEVSPVRVSDLDERERAMVDWAASVDELIQVTWDATPDGEAHGRVTQGPHLENRAGQVQGGILYGAASRAAERALGVSRAAISDGHYHFLRPCNGAAVVHATTVRKGRSVATARVDVLDGDLLVGTAQFALRPAVNP